MNSNNGSFILYYNPYSICSIMVRYVIAIAGQPRDASSHIEIKEQSVDIFNDGQLDEHFLCDVNPKGQVPVLVPPAPAKPIPDSLEITHFLGDHYPTLIPDERRTEITQLLEALHSISFFSLTFGTRRPEMGKKFLDGINSRLQGDISEKYREALKYKLSVTTNEKVASLESDAARANEDNVRSVINKITPHLSQDSPWLFGSRTPSALDAHLVVFVARMRDIDRYELIPSNLQSYAEKAWSTAAFQKVMEGRKTVVGK